MIRIALIGYGYWGPNLFRNFNSLENCEITVVVDSNFSRLEVLKKNYPSIECYSDVDSSFDKNVDAVIIATNVKSHYLLAKKFLRLGKHVLIEKPMTASVSESQELIEIAKKNELTLMVDHTFLYTSAVQEMKKIIECDELGSLQYFDSTRINLGLFQPDINVLWDLAPHDISILTHLVPHQPISVNATGVSHTKNSVENIAYLTLNFKEDFIAHFNCSWTSPVKVRSTLLGGDKKMMLYNDLEPSEKIRVYNTSYNHKTDVLDNRILVDYRVGDIFIPKISNHEALQEMAKDFVNSIKNKTIPISSALLGLKVVQILEAAEQSLKLNGKEIYINYNN